MFGVNLAKKIKACLVGAGTLFLNDDDRGLVKEGEVGGGLRGGGLNDVYLHDTTREEGP